MYDPRVDIVQEIQQKDDKLQIVSLGDHCLVAKYLSLFGMRNCSYPFDWIQATPKMIQHCLEDDFKIYSSLQSEGFYSQFTQQEIFKHHDVANSIAYHKRCVERFKNLSNISQKVFCATCCSVDFETWRKIAHLLKTKYNIFCNIYIICLGCDNTDKHSSVSNIVVTHMHDIQTSNADVNEEDQKKLLAFFISLSK